MGGPAVCRTSHGGDSKDEPRRAGTRGRARRMTSRAVVSVAGHPNSSETAPTSGPLFGKGLRQLMRLLGAGTRPGSRGVRATRCVRRVHSVAGWLWVRMPGVGAPGSTRTPSEAVTSCPGPPVETPCGRASKFGLPSALEGVYRELLDLFPAELPTTVRVRIVLGAHPDLDRVALAAALELGGTARQVSVQISRAVTTANALLAPARAHAAAGPPARHEAAMTGGLPGPHHDEDEAAHGHPDAGMLTWLCAECGTRFPALAIRGLLYCQPRCREIGKYVRYHRGVITRYGDLPLAQLPEDIREALLHKRPHLLGEGPGYDAVARRLSPTRRTEVITRDHGRCVLCAAPGEEIDHIDGDSDDPSNLRLLCRPCHRDVTADHLKPATETSRVRAAELDARVYAAHPQRPQDDAVTWASVKATWVADHARLVPLAS